MQNSVLIKKKIEPFSKKILVSSDKSLSIRSILISAQGIGKSKVKNLLESEDVLNALKAIKKLGIKVKKKNKEYLIFGNGLNGFRCKNNTTVYAGNSGTLGRLILGLLVKFKKSVIITGDNSLSKRDFSRVAEPLKLFGPIIDLKKGSLPAKIKGTNFLRPINYYEKKGSAQIKSSILIAAMNTPGKTIIKARKSRNHTELLFKYLKLPIKVQKARNYDYIHMEGLRQYKGFEYEIPGDISSASFFIVLTLLSENSKIIIRKVNINETRLGIIKILNKMNANIKFKNKKIYKGESIADIIVESVKNLKSINCPSSLNSSAIDEFLVIFLVAAKARGISSFKNLGELNKKESPRLNIAFKFLNMIGVKVIKNKDDIKIYGNPNLSLNKNYVVKKFLKDHRIFMMSCVAALTFGGNWKIYDKDSIRTSFPKFLSILRKIGAKIIVN